MVASTEREDGDVGAQAEGQREHSNDDEAGAMHETAGGQAKIVTEGFPQQSVF